MHWLNAILSKSTNNRRTNRVRASRRGAQQRHLQYTIESLETRRVLAELHGMVFNDLAGDQVPTGDPGLPWIVGLDTNDNSVIDPGEPTTQSAPDGSYSFTGLAAGEYTVLVDALPGWTQTTPFAPGNDAIQDGGFEGGSPNAAWTEASTNFGSPLCNLACGPGTLPASGDWVAWMGGVNADEVSSVEQTINIPADADTLQFSLAIPFSSENVLDTFVVTMDGQELFALNATEAGNFPDHTPVVLDITAFADGGDHTLNFTSTTFGTGLNGTNTSIFVDDVSLITGAGPINTTVVLAVDDVVQDIDYGYQQTGTASISGLIFDDADQSGVQDGGETGLEAWDVFLDLNDNDQHDPFEPITSTDASGAYSFDGLGAATYGVEVIAPQFWQQTAPGGPVSFDLNVGDTVADADFGYFFDGPDGLISGIVFDDVNQDGVQDPGENGIPGWNVTLDLNNNGQIDNLEPNTLTAADGSYSFGSLVAGTYPVLVQAPPVWQQTAPLEMGEAVADGGFELGTPNAAWTEASDNFGTTICSIACGLGGGTGPNSGDFWSFFGGVVGDETGSLTQTVTVPANATELSFWLEIPTVSGPGTLSVTIDGDELFAVTEADAADYQTYTQVLLDISAYADGGDHELQFSSTSSAATNLMVDDVSIPFTGPPTNHVIVLAEDEQLVGADYGFFEILPPDGEISGVVFDDLDGNGVQDVGETGWEGFTVTLDLNGNGQADPGEPTSVTDMGGNYQFNGLVGGEYGVLVETPVNFVQTSPLDPANAVRDGSFELGTPNAEWAESSTNFGTTLCTVALCGAGGGTGPRTGETWSFFGGANGEEAGSLTQNLAIPTDAAELSFWLEIPTADAAGTLTVSIDGNELFSVTDADAANFAAYTQVNLDITAFADGGQHELVIASTSSGVTNFMVDDVAIIHGVPGIHVVNLADGETFGEADYGFQFIPPPPMGTISGTVYDDFNGNGVQDPGEFGIFSWGVFLDLNDNGVADQGEPLTTTDADGNYEFTDLESETYPVLVIPAADWVQTAPFQPGSESVADGGFEGGTPNADWAEASDAFGTPLCSVGTCGNGGGTGPNSGDFFVWFGGVDAVETGSVTQTITIPSEATDLTFWLEIPAASGTGNDNMTVTLDGNVLFTVTDAEAANFATYAQVSLDITAFADDGDHVLQFSSAVAGGGITNFFLDDVSLAVDGQLLTQIVNLGQDEMVSEVDYGFMMVAPPDDAQIGGTVFDDTNRDGVQDPGEPGIEGWTVFLDLNNNQTLDQGEPSTLTDIDGNYNFTDLPQGTYEVVVEEQPLWTQTTPISPPLESIADGSFEGGSPNADWTEASDAFGTPLCSVATCGDGGATGPNSGDFWVWFGGVDGLENGSVEQTVTIPADATDLDFWLEIPAGSGTGTDVLTVSIDGNELFSVTDAEAANFATYQLVSLDVTAFADGGEHVLLFSSTVNGGGITNFFVDDVTLTTGGGLINHIVDLAPSQVVDDASYGFFSEVVPGGQINGSLFNDLNADGIQNAGEPPLENWDVFLDINDNGMHDNGEPLSMTDASGAYSFNGLDPDVYSVLVDSPPAWFQTAPVTFPQNAVADFSFEGGTPNADWAEASTNFGTPLCTFATCGGGASVDGDFFVWFGGVGEVEEGSVQQDLVIPANATELQFWLAANGSGLGTDTFSVSIDGNELFSITDAEAADFAQYTSIVLDISAFADDASHSLLFSATTNGTGPNGVTSFLLDSVSLPFGGGDLFTHLVEVGPDEVVSNIIYGFSEVPDVLPVVEAVDVNAVEVDSPDLPEGPQPTSWAQQRSYLHSIRVTFNQEMIVTANDLVLTNLGVEADVDDDTVVPLDDAQITVNGNELVILFEGPNRLDDGVYQLEVLDTATNLQGTALDGDADGMLGGNFVEAGDVDNRLYQLTADYNGDLGVTAFDIVPFVYWYGIHQTPVPAYMDLDGDGQVSIFDFPALAANFGNMVMFPAAPRPILEEASDDARLIPAPVSPFAGQLREKAVAERLIERLDFSRQSEVRERVFEKLARDEWTADELDVEDLI